MTPQEARILSYIWTLKHSESRGTVQQHHSSRAAAQLPEWNRPSPRSTGSDWPAPAAPPNSPGLWSRHSADSGQDITSHSQTSANSQPILCSIMGLLCSLHRLWCLRRHHLRVMALSWDCRESDHCTRDPDTTVRIFQHDNNIKQLISRKLTWNDCSVVKNLPFGD